MGPRPEGGGGAAGGTYKLTSFLHEAVTNGLLPSVRPLCHGARSPFWIEGKRVVVRPKATSSDGDFSTGCSLLLERPACCPFLPSPLLLVPLQGRMLHVLPSTIRKEASEDASTPGSSSYKKKKEAKDKANSSRCFPRTRL